MAGQSHGFKSRLAEVLRSPYFWAFVVRAAFFAVMSPIAFRGDAASYEQLATNLAAGHGFSTCPVAPFPPTAQRPPLFSLLLSGLYFLGAGNLTASFVLNLALDLLSVWLAGIWANENGFGKKGARRFSWVVALCPLLISYSPYPTTENLSICVFLIATLLTFRLSRAESTGRSGWKWAAAGGLFWGLLALCRSYYLLFPVALFVFPTSPKWRRTQLALLLVCSGVAPSIWAVRNYAAFGKPSFSQGSTVGWQSYQGLCFTNFDWWDAHDVERIYQHPVLSQFLASTCRTDVETAALDHQVRDEVIQDCVLDRPVDAAVNATVKAVMLFINWGQVLPYTEISGWIRWPINLLMTYYWWCVVVVLLRQRRERGKKSNPSARFALTGTLYVLGVTLPFAVDSRYLLGPFLITLVVALEAAGGVAALSRAGLIWTSRPSRRGSRTP